jgi:hypothetical protein
VDVVDVSQVHDQHPNLLVLFLRNESDELAGVEGGLPFLQIRIPQTVLASKQAISGLCVERASREHIDTRIEPNDAKESAPHASRVRMLGGAAA